MQTKADRTTNISPAQEDYLKAIFQLAGGDQRVGTSALSRRLGVSSPSVTEMLGKLAAQRLVTYDRYRGASLTDKGKRIAVEMVRHHRLVESYLTNFLGYGWDEVHDEADRLEHVISELMERRMFDALGQPGEDPHGDPIPTIEGKVARSEFRSLIACQVGDRVTIKRVSDQDAHKLRALTSLGLELGAPIEIVEASEYEGPIVIRLRNRRIQVPIGLARAVSVE